MIVIYTGKRGSGKTLTMVKDTINFYHEGWPIYTNITTLKIPSIHISEEEMLNIDKHSDIKNCVLVIDELQILFDSRSSMKNVNKKFSNFIQQIRKRNIILLSTTQYTNTIDKRIRQHLDIKVEPYFDKKLEVVEAFYIDLTSIGNNGVFEHYIPIEEQAKSVNIVFEADQVYKYYDTEERL